MLPSFELLPWFSPKLSKAMTGVLLGLGHSVKFKRGEVLYRSTDLFGRLIFVRKGLVAKAILDPVREEPLLLTMSATGGLCGCYENLYVRDRMARRHWCLTSSEVLMVNPELLLKIADQNPVWQRELTNYSTISALCDRLGMMINQSGTYEQRLGIFLLMLVLESGRDIERDIQTRGIEWIELPVIPPRSVTAAIIGTTTEIVGSVLNGWVKAKVVRYRSHRVWLHRATFLEYWNWLMPYLKSLAN